MPHLFYWYGNRGPEECSDLLKVIAVLCETWTRVGLLTSGPFVLSVVPCYHSCRDLFEMLSAVLWQWQWHMIRWVCNCTTHGCNSLGIVWCVNCVLTSSRGFRAAGKSFKVLDFSILFPWACKDFGTGSLVSTLNLPSLFSLAITSCWPVFLKQPWDSLCLFLVLPSMHTWDWADIWQRGVSAWNLA